jgi:hypothetical protein
MDRVIYFKLKIYLKMHRVKYLFHLLGQGNGFLRAIKVLSTPSYWMGIKTRRSHVVRV